RPRIEDLARGRRRHPGYRAVQQLDLQFVLQDGELLAERRLRNATGGRGPRYAAAVHDLHEITKPAAVHGGIISDDHGCDHSPGESAPADPPARAAVPEHRRPRQRELRRVADERGAGALARGLRLWEGLKNRR